jgi:hypothetical protein
VDQNLEEELEQFESDFERDEVFELYLCEMNFFATMLILF